MRKFVISMIAVFGVIMLGLIILMITAISSGGISTHSSFTISHAELVNTSNISMEGIEELTLEYSSDDIFFYESDTSELILMEYMSIAPDENELTRVKQSGSKLRLQGGDRMRRNWIFNYYNGYVEVYLPTNYRGSISASTSSGNIETDLIFTLADFAAACSSGDIYINEVSAAKISAATTSGNIDFNKAEGTRSFASSSGDIRILGGNGDTDVSCTSGNITVHNNTGALNAEASSGDITVKAVVGYKEIETTSGNLQLSDCSGYLKATASSGDTIISDLDGAGSFKSTSGNINVSFTDSLNANNEDIEAVSSSGDVTLKIPGGASFDFEANTSSGDIDTFFDESLSYKKDGDHANGTVGDNPTFRMELETTSGSITVKD